MVAPKRGNILDTHGETLAIDIRVDSVYASPHKIKDPEALISSLTDILSLKQEKIKTRLKNKKLIVLKTYKFIVQLLLEDHKQDRKMVALSLLLEKAG